MVTSASRIVWLASSTALAGSLLWASAAAAQTGTANATASPSTSVEEVTVTGTRVQRNGYDAPTPTTVLGPEVIERKAVTNAMDLLSTLPALRSNATAQTNGASTGGTLGQSFVNLRGLGPSRTLVLLDHKRLVPTTGVGSVDVSLMPTLLLSRVDVVTGGASAAWGSDAVSGVVNFVLDTNFVGVKGVVQGGITTRNDGESGQVGLAYGGRLLDDRLHVLASGEYYHTEGVPPRQRPWAAYPSMDIVPNPTFTATNGQAPQLLRPFVYQNIVNGGTITSGPLAGISFGPGGQPYQTPFCALRTASQQICTSDQHDLFNNSNQFIYMLSPQTRANGLLRVAYDLTPDWQLYAQGMYAESKTKIQSSAFSTSVSGVLTIRNDNPFIPDPIRQQMTARNITSFTLGTFAKNMGPSVVDRDNALYSGIVGLKGKLGGWQIDGYYNYGRAHATLDILRNTARARVTEAVDAVRAPNGTVVCRSALSNPTTACQPLNLFGPDSFSPAAAAYIQGTSMAVQNTRQDVVAIQANGEPFSTWAGPVSMAFGLEYRHNSISQKVDPLSQVGGWGLLNPRAYHGSDSNKEAFAEAVVPLAKDAPWARSLDLDLAGRYTDYRSAGGVFTWKAGLTWRVTDEVMLRATQSRDIRAPSLQELYATSVGSTAVIIDRSRNAGVSAQGRTQGNPDLRYEESDTTALGVVYSPGWISGLRFSIDYYRISLNDPIATLTFQQIEDRCEATDQSLCSLVHRDPVSGTILSVDAPYLNFGSVKTDGVDFDASYRMGLESLFGAGAGQLELRAIASYLHEFKVNDGVTVIDRAGSLASAGNTANFSGNPKWVWNVNGAYTRGPFTAYLEGVFYSGGAYDTSFAPGQLDGNHVGSDYALNGRLSYTFNTGSQRYELYLNVDNITDKAPPPELSYNGGNYDRVGRAYKLGLRFSF
jgi:iron complex outermembrane receptor protein